MPMAGTLKSIQEYARTRFLQTTRYISSTNDPLGGVLTIGTGKEKWHGTRNGYGYHKCRCEPCVLVNRAQSTKFRAEKAALRVEKDGVLVQDMPPHGSSGRYSNWSCRCAECTAAHSVHCKKQKDKRMSHRIVKDGVVFNPKAKHGTPSGYSAFGCRCIPCSNANRDRERKRRMEKKSVR